MINSCRITTENRRMTTSAPRPREERRNTAVDIRPCYSLVLALDKEVSILAKRVQKDALYGLPVYRTTVYSNQSAFEVLRERSELGERRVCCLSQGAFWDTGPITSQLYHWLSEVLSLECSWPSGCWTKQTVRQS